MKDKASWTSSLNSFCYGPKNNAQTGMWYTLAVKPLVASVPLYAYSSTSTAMLLIRDVFRCKPGKARQVAELFKRIQPSVEQHDGYRNVRIMVDLVTNYWTVVLEAEVEELTQFEHHMRSFGTRPEDQEVIRGYLDLVEGGHREIYRIL